MNSPSTRLVLLALLMAAGMAGCASLDARPAFHQVQRDVADRTGELVQWNTGSDEDAAVASKVRAMLAEELTLQQTVQIVLLNNRRLLGTYTSS
jgi:hypothetical protein